MRLRACRHLSVAIAREAAEVHAFAARPENLPRWAAGLGGAVRAQGAAWCVDTPAGPLRLRFAPPNELGVLDHWVTLPDGRVVDVPMRVLPNGAGAEVVFTLFRQPGMSDAEFERDAGLVAADLAALKRLLEA